MSEAETPINKKFKLTIETATIIVAIIAFIGSSFGSFTQGYFAQKQQKSEFESTLIINAIETGNSTLSKNNLRFLLDAGLITKKEIKLNLLRILIDTSYYISRRKSLNNEDSVYICLNQNSHKYHALNNCNLLNQCNDTILKVTVLSAVTMYKRSECALCN